MAPIRYLLPGLLPHLFFPLFFRHTFQNILFADSDEPFSDEGDDGEEEQHQQRRKKRQQQHENEDVGEFDDEERFVAPNAHVESDEGLGSDADEEAIDPANIVEYTKSVLFFTSKMCN